MTKSDPKVDLLAAVAASYASRADVTADDIVALVAKLRREFGEIESIAPVDEVQVRSPGRAEPARPAERCSHRSGFGSVRGRRGSASASVLGCG